MAIHWPLPGLRLPCALIACALAQASWATEPDDQPDIYLLDEAKHVVRQLTDDVRQESWPTWSPDGKRVAYATIDLSIPQDFLGNQDVPQEPRRSRIDAYDLASGSTEIILEGPHNYYDPAWSPDGDHILFTTDAGGGSRLGVYHVPSGVARFLPSAPGQLLFAHGPIWSPDGMKLAYMACDALRERSHLYVMDWPGNQPKLLAALDTMAAALDWDALRNQILITAATATQADCGVGSPARVWELWRVNAQTGARSKLPIENPHIALKVQVPAMRERLNTSHCPSLPLWAIHRQNTDTYCVLMCLYPINEPRFYELDAEFQNAHIVETGNSIDNTHHGFLQFAEQTDGKYAAGVWALKQSDGLLSFSHTADARMARQVLGQKKPIAYAHMGAHGEIFFPPQELTIARNLIAIYREDHKLILHMEGYGYRKGLLEVRADGKIDPDASGTHFTGMSFFPKRWPFAHTQRGAVLPLEPCLILDKTYLGKTAPLDPGATWLLRTADHQLFVPPENMEVPPIRIEVSPEADGLKLWERVGPNRHLFMTVHADRAISVDPAYPDLPYEDRLWAYEDGKGKPMCPSGARQLMFLPNGQTDPVLVTDQGLQHAAGGP